MKEPDVYKSTERNVGWVGTCVVTLNTIYTDAALITLRHISDYTLVQSVEILRMSKKGKKMYLRIYSSERNVTREVLKSLIETPVVSMAETLSNEWYDATVKVCPEVSE